MSDRTLFKLDDSSESVGKIDIDNRPSKINKKENFHEAIVDEIFQMKIFIKDAIISFETTLQGRSSFVENTNLAKKDLEKEIKIEELRRLLFELHGLEESVNIEDSKQETLKYLQREIHSVWELFSKKVAFTCVKPLNKENKKNYKKILGFIKNNISAKSGKHILIFKYKNIVEKKYCWAKDKIIDPNEVFLMSNIIQNEAGSGMVGDPARLNIAYAYLNRTGGAVTSPHGDDISHYMSLQKRLKKKVKTPQQVKEYRLLDSSKEGRNKEYKQLSNNSIVKEYLKLLKKKDKKNLKFDVKDKKRLKVLKKNNDIKNYIKLEKEVNDYKKLKKIDDPNLFAKSFLHSLKAAEIRLSDKHPKANDIASWSAFIDGKKYTIPATHWVSKGALTSKPAFSVKNEEMSKILEVSQKSGVGTFYTPFFREFTPDGVKKKKFTLYTGQRLNSDAKKEYESKGGVYDYPPYNFQKMKSSKNYKSKYKEIVAMYNQVRKDELEKFKKDMDLFRKSKKKLTKPDIVNQIEIQKKLFKTTKKK